REVDVDRHGLGETKAAIVDRGDAARRIDRQEFGRLRAAVGETGRNVLVLQPDLATHPQGPRGPRSGMTVDLQHSSLLLRGGESDTSAICSGSRSRSYPRSAPLRATPPTASGAHAWSAASP